MAMSANVTTKDSTFDELRADWQALLRRDGSTDPTLSPLWLETWWRVFGSEGGRSFKLLSFRAGGELVGVAAFVQRRHVYGAIPFRRIESMASGEPERDEIASDYLGLIAATGYQREVARVFCEELCRGRFGPWDEFVYPRARRASAITSELYGELRRRGMDVEEETVSLCRYIPLPDSWDGYLKRLSPSRRQWLKRTLRQYEKWAGEPPVLVRATDERSLVEGQRILIDLHQRCWQRRGKPGAFSSPAFYAFHEQLMPALLARGALDLLWINAHGRPIAALYNIHWNGRVHFYQSGRDLEVPPRLRPGIVIHALAIQDAIARGMAEYDFLAGDAAYKKSLSIASRDLVTLRATPKGSRREQARRTLTRGWRTLKRLTTRPPVVPTYED